jgi:hypothetical protein
MISEANSGSGGGNSSGGGGKAAHAHAHARRSVKLHRDECTSGSIPLKAE